MSKFEEALQRYAAEMEALGISDVDPAMLRKITKGLGPTIYDADASVVATSDAEEVERVKSAFLIRKLGLKDGPSLDAAIADVAEEMGSDNRNKYRAIFYYLLVKKLGQESFYG